MNRFFLAGVLLRSCSAVSLLRNARSDRESEACTGAAPGHWCHAAVMWAKVNGYKQHPDWFPGDASQYSLRDFQSLLHSLGEAECSQPCADSRALGLLEFGESSTAKHGEESSKELDQTSTYGFAPAEFLEIMEESWEPKALTSSRGGDNTDEVGCHDAQRGSICYLSMTYLRVKGIAKHPTWYPSLNGDSTMRDVQEVLYKGNKSDCPKPCPDHGAQQLKNFPDSGVIEIMDDGRQVAAEVYELKKVTDCGDTVEGEWCYNSIMWLKNTGLAKHPNWYPRLTRESSMADFQTALHNQHKMTCPLPCKSIEAELEEEEVSQGDITTTFPVSIRAGSEQCEVAREGSHCYRAISRVIDVGIWRHPEQFVGLDSHSSRDQVQKHLYLTGKYECGWPCPKKQIAKTRRVAKKVEDMTEKELARFMSHEWDGYVDADEYDPHEAVQPSQAETAVGARASKSASASAAEEKNRPVAAEGAKEPEEGVDAATVPSKDENPPKLQPVIRPKRETAAGLQSQCRDAKVGELCYSAVIWARGVGILERPQWYTGLSNMSSFREFQAFLHETRPGICEMPCGNLREARPFEAEAEAADASEELLPVVDGSGQKFVRNTTAEPTPEPEVQANPTAEEPALEEAEKDTSEEVGSGQEFVRNTTTEPTPEPEVASIMDYLHRVQANSTAEEPALEEAEKDTSEEVLPAADQDGQENDSAVEPAPQREEANSTVEEPAPQPEAATVEAAESDTSDEALPAVDLDGQEVNITVEDTAAMAQQREASSTEEANSSAEEPAPQPEAATVEPAENATAAEVLRWLHNRPAEEANFTAEEPAPQPEAATVEAAEAETSEEPLPVVDRDGQEIDIDIEDMAAIAQQAKEQASEPPSAENATVEAEQAAALQDADNDTEAGKEPASQSEAATVESDTSEEPLPVVNPDAQEVDIAFEDTDAISQQREADKERAELQAKVEALKFENAALKANSIVQPAPALEASEPQSIEDGR